MFGSTRFKVANADTVLLAYMAFKQPQKIRLAYLIPKDRAAWLEYLVHLVRKKTVIKYLSDKELKKVILRAKPNLTKRHPPFVRDRDCPDSVYWTEDQVADWIEEIGFPHLKDAFRKNFINGRRLVNIDASALNQMGVQDFKQIKNVATQIREVLQIHRPNILRAIARKVPFEQYLRIHAKTGNACDGLTFEKFCEDYGYSYELLRRNKLALIPCTVSVQISGLIIGPESEFGSSSGSEASSENLSLENAPSVEFIVRHQMIRDRTIQKIIDEILTKVFDPKSHKRFAIEEIFRRILEEAFLELGFGDPEIYTKERVEFAIGIAEVLIKDMLRSVEVLNDIRKFEVHLKEETQKEDFNLDELLMIRDVAHEFMEEVIPIAALLALGQFSLESIFKEQPEFEEYITEIINEAETKTNELVPTAEEFINDVLSEARLQVLAQQHFPYLSLETVRSAKSLANHIIDELLENSTNIAAEFEVEGEGFWGGEDEETRFLHRPRTRRRINEYGEVEISARDENMEDSEWIEVRRPAKKYQRMRKDDYRGSLPSGVEGQQYQIGVAMRGKSRAKQRSELTVLPSQKTISSVSGGRISASATSMTSNQSGGSGRAGRRGVEKIPKVTQSLPIMTRAGGVSGTGVGGGSRVQTAQRRMTKKQQDQYNAIPKVSVTNGKMFDKAGGLIGALDRRGTIRSDIGAIVGSIAQNGIVVSKNGFVLGRIGGLSNENIVDQEIMDFDVRPRTASGYRVGLGPAGPRGSMVRRSTDERHSFTGERHSSAEERHSFTEERPVSVPLEETLDKVWTSSKKFLAEFADDHEGEDDAGVDRSLEAKMAQQDQRRRTLSIELEKIKEEAKQEQRRKTVEEAKAEKRSKAKARKDAARTTAGGQVDDDDDDASPEGSDENIPAVKQVLTEKQKQELWTNVQLGNMRTFVDPHGHVMGNFTPEGQLIATGGFVIGELHENGELFNLEGTKHLKTPGNILNEDGVVVGEFDPVSGLIKSYVLETQAKGAPPISIGKIFPDGRIGNAEGDTIGVLNKDGRIYSTGGKFLAYYTEAGHIVKSDGTPLAYVAADTVNGGGTLYKMDVAPGVKEEVPHFRAEEPAAQSLVTSFRKQFGQDELNFQIKLFESASRLQKTAKTAENAAIHELEVLHNAHHQHHHHHHHDAEEQDRRGSGGSGGKRRTSTPEHHHGKSGPEELGHFHETIEEPEVGLEDLLEQDRMLNEAANGRLEQAEYDQLRHERRSRSGSDMWDEIEQMRGGQAKAKQSLITSSMIERDPAVLERKKLRRREMVQNWAHDAEEYFDFHKDDEPPKGEKSDEYLRTIRLTADTIVNEILQLALTHLLLDAESGQDTKRVMIALRKARAEDETSANIPDHPAPQTGLPQSILTRPNEPDLKKAGHKMAVVQTIQNAYKNYQNKEVKEN